MVIQQDTDKKVGGFKQQSGKELARHNQIFFGEIIKSTKALKKN